MKRLALLLALSCAVPTLPTPTEEVTVKLPAAGLFTNPSPLGGEVPAGALSRARNVVMDRPDVVKPRPGQAPGEGALLASRALGHLAEHDGQVYGMSSLGDWYLRGLADWTPLPPRSAPPDVPFTAEAGGVLVLPTGDGPRVLEAGALRAAGVPRALDALTWPAYSAEWYATGAAAWLPALATAGYRVSLARKDATGRVLRGAPSGRVVIYNVAAGGGTAIFPVLTIPLPEDATVEHFVEVWRTRAAADGADPGDAMQKVAEVALDAAAITAGQVVLTDEAPDAFRGEAAYFNAAQDGLAAMRLQPPAASVVGAFRDQALYGDAHERHTVSLRLLANLAHGDVVTVLDQTYTGNDSEVAMVDDFHVETDALTYSVSQMIEITARSLVDAINLRRDGFVARYDSGENDPPGLITIERLSLSQGTFDVTVSAGPERFLPALPQDSRRIERPGRTYVALKDQPGAVPLFATVEPGDATKATLAYAPLRESLFVFKEDGLFRLLPLPSGGMTWEPFNDTLRLLAPRSLAVLEGRLYALTNKGIVSVSDGGVEEASYPFTPTLEEALRASDAETLRTRAFGVADEKAKRYTLWLPTAPGAAEASRAFVLNLATDTWTERDDSATCGLVTEDAGLVLGHVDGTLSTERRTGTVADYQDADGEALAVDVAWVEDALGDGGAQKHFRDVAAVFLHDVPEGREYGFDFAADGAAQLSAEVPAEGGPYVRAEVPEDAQRCTRLGLGVRRQVLAEAFELAGLEVRGRGFKGRLAR